MLAAWRVLIEGRKIETPIEIALFYSQMKKLLKDGLTAAARATGGTILVIGLVSVFLAPQFWLADLLINFRVHFVGALLLCLLPLVMWRRPVSALLLLAGTVFLAWPVLAYLKLPFSQPVTLADVPDDQRVYRLLCYNVYTANIRYEDVSDFVADTRADFVLFIETDKRWADEMDWELRDHYEHRFAEPRSDNFGMSFYSKLPWKEIRLLEHMDQPAIEAVFDLPEGPLRMIGIHPTPPMRASLAASRNAQFEKLGEYLATLPVTEKRIVAGDFNLTPWSPHFKRLLERCQLSDSAVGRGIQNTWYRAPLLVTGLPIDHVLVSESIDVIDRRIGPPIGSDHRPLLVDLWLHPSD